MATEEKLPDELQDQPEDPLSITKDENRMNTIMKIDTSAAGACIGAAASAHRDRPS